MTRRGAAGPGSSRALGLALLGAGLALVLLVLWLFGAGQDAGGDAALGESAQDLSGFELDAFRAADDQLTAATSSDAAIPLDVPAGRSVPVARVEPVRAYDRKVLLAPDANYVSSRVLDADGVPVAGARVLLYKFFSGQHGGRYVMDIDEATTDADGRFEVGRGEADWFAASWTADWRLSVRAEGQPRWHGYAVAAGAPVDVLLPPAREAQLVLRLEDGEPLAGASVREYLVHAQDPDEAEAWWSWGVTGASGVLPVTLAADHLEPLVAIEHPEHKSIRRLPPPDADGTVLLELPRGRAVDVVWRGDISPYVARGLNPPRARLVHVNSGGHPYWTPPHFEFSRRRSEGVDHFEHLSSEPVVIRAPWDGPDLGEAFVPPVGRTRFEVAVPPIDAFVPGESRWGFRVRVVVEGPEPSKRPSARVRATDGAEKRASVWPTMAGDVRTMFSDLAPPLTVWFPDWGLDGPRVDGVMPGDEVELIVDASRALDFSAAIQVDTRHLDAVRAANVRLRVLPEGSRSAAYPHRGRTRVFGLPAGRWSYTLRGDGVERLDGVVELAVGDEHVLQPLPAAWSVADALPHDLVDPHGIVEGTVTLEGDPWTYATQLTLSPTPGERAGESTGLRVRGGGFRGAVEPGVYDVNVMTASTRYPSASIRQGFGVEDDHRVEFGTVTVDPPLQIRVIEGQRRELAVTARSAPARGFLRVRLRLDGEPAPATYGASSLAQYYDATWTGSDGQQTRKAIHALHEGVLNVCVPQGRGTLRVSPQSGERSAFLEPLEPAEIELDVPPPYDTAGTPQALEFELELRAPEAAVADGG